VCKLKHNPEIAVDLVKKAILRVKRVTGNAERVAVEDAAGTVLPPELFQQDTAGLRPQGNLENLVRL
jgi:hypothetical protein